MKEHIKKFNSIEVKFDFIPKLNKKIEIIENIKNFGEIVNEASYIDNLDDSLIIKDNKEYNNKLKNWINKENNIKAELLYRFSRDGDKISKFHELCDGKGPTLTLFKVKEGIGGIYTPLSWDIKSETKYDNKTFMFNLNKKEKYINIDKVTSIWCTKNFGPWTVDFGFYKINQMNKIEHRGICINNSYENGSEILPNYSKEIKYFDVIEVEVYKII